jgi:16S rRNA (uracil1498-N3)-methyltransferase
MHRFHCPPGAARGDEFDLPATEAHHAAVVLRLQAGDAAEVLPGDGSVLHGTLAEVARRRAVFRVSRREQRGPRAAEITLFQCVPRAGAMEWIIEKAAELGADRIVPVLSERTVVRLDPGDNAKPERWRQTAVAALKQCGGPWLARVEPARRFQDALVEDAGELKLVGALRAPQRSIRDCCTAFQQRHVRAASRVSLWIGPEGDFTGAELDALLARGTEPVVFCDQVLRAETAAVAALAVLVNELRPPGAGGVQFGAWGTG